MFLKEVKWYFDFRHARYKAIMGNDYAGGQGCFNKGLFAGILPS